MQTQGIQAIKLTPRIRTGWLLIAYFNPGDE